MVARAAEKCGMDTELSGGDAAEILSAFIDGGAVSAWAKNGVAFCCAEGILEADNMKIEPTRPILRCEIAQMLYNLLGSAKLL